MTSNKGFSIAEILLGMGMLAVISVLTISSLVTSTDETKLYNTKYDRMYGDIFTAAEAVLLLDRKGTRPFSQSEGAKSIKDAFASRLDVATALDKSGYEPFILLQNGTKIVFRVGDDAKSADVGYENFVGALVIDFNGSKGPNELGVDIREIPLCSYGICTKLKKKEE